MDYPDLAALHADLRTCQRCAQAGHAIFSQPIFAGRTPARLMLVGQAPGPEEGPIGQPFSGSAGKRLFRWLVRAGWNETDFRARCYITSITKCFPGKAHSGSGDRVPSAAERALCRPWLEWELQLVQPLVIAAVGKLAIEYFIPGGGTLNNLIGEVYTGADGRRIVPLPHPSGASRWHMKAENSGRLEGALFQLKMLKVEYDL